MTRPVFTGSVLTGTLRPEDMLPAFIDALEQLAPDAPDTVRLRAEVNLLEDRAAFDTERGDEALNDLYVALNDALPEGWRFGAHEGDGADLGVWEVDLDD